MKRCSHHWAPYTVHKARCTSCGHKTPWLDIVRDAKERARGALDALRDAAKASRPLRRHAEHLRKLFEVYNEAGVE